MDSYEHFAFLTFKEMICELLRGAGFPQDGEGWYWVGGYDEDREYQRVLVYLPLEVVRILQAKGADIVRAPTWEELLDWCLAEPGKRVADVIAALGGGVYKVELPERGGD